MAINQLNGAPSGKTNWGSYLTRYSEYEDEIRQALEASRQLDGEGNLNGQHKDETDLATAEAGSSYLEGFLQQVGTKTREFAARNKGLPVVSAMNIVSSRIAGIVQGNYSTATKLAAQVLFANFIDSLQSISPDQVLGKIQEVSGELQQLMRGVKRKNRTEKKILNKKL